MTNNLDATAAEIGRKMNRAARIRFLEFYWKPTKTGNAPCSDVVLKFNISLFPLLFEFGVHSKCSCCLPHQCCIGFFRRMGRRRDENIQSGC